MEYLALFFTTSASIKFKRKLLKMEISVEALPVPRILSSACGVAVHFFWPDSPLLLLDNGVEKLYAVEKAGYKLIYKAEPPLSV